MRNINYILINETHPHSGTLKCRNRLQRNERYHYIVNTAGVVLNPIDIHQPGAMDLKPREPEQRIFFNSLNDRSIGIQYNGNLARDFELASRSAKLFGSSSLPPLSTQLMALIQLLLELREHFPSAVILGVDELDRWQTRVNPTMNLLRTELSNIGYNPESEE